MNQNQYQHLRQLLGGYLHQDWRLDFSTPEEAIGAFKEKEPQECIEGVCRELEEVIPLIKETKEPEKFLWQVLWCYYNPQADGLTVADWLERVHKQLCD